MIQTVLCRLGLHDWSNWYSHYKKMDIRRRFCWRYGCAADQIQDDSRVKDKPWL